MSDKEKGMAQKIYFGVSKYLYKISPELKVKLDYKLSTGKKLNLKNPTDFNEKLQWLNLYDNNPLRIECADKYGVREYLIKKGLDKYLPNLLGVYDKVDEINFESLPQKFVLKCTHGCGFNIICKDKSELNIEDAKSKLNKWLHTDFGAEAGEIQYSKIKPKIICEEFLDALDTDVPIDYKIHCFNGKPKFVMACVDRYKDLSFLFYDFDWNRLEYQSKSYYSEKKATKPKNLNEMIEISKKIAKDFKFVRVDFFEIEGKVYIGELTFTPNAGRIKYINDETLIEVGNMLKIK